MSTSRIVEVPLSLLAKPRSGEALADHWWVIREGRALFWRGYGSKGYAPQCNRDRRITERIQQRMYADCAVEHVEVAYLGRWDPEWGHTLSRDLLEAAAAILQASAASAAERLPETSLNVEGDT